MTDAVHIRAGREGDGSSILRLWDEAIAWLVCRGQTGQWGTEPASSRARNREMVREWETGPGLRMAEMDGVQVGASVIVENPPDYVPPASVSESYLYFLISDRSRAGTGIGSALVRRAADEARKNGSEILRVDCWADAPTLVDWYVSQGFVPSGTFTVADNWRGQVFEMKL
jgi:GNAT superfamily N-acetyltransferase